jgi:hypothetical protein
VFANPRLQTLIRHGGPSVLYPSRRKFTAATACPSAAGIDSAASAAGAADSVAFNNGGAAASHALVGARSVSGQDANVESNLEVSIIKSSRDESPSRIELWEFSEEPNAMMYDLFRKIPGFEDDNDAPLTAAEHEAALAAFGSSARQKFEALLFEFPMLEQSIGARGANYESAKHVHVAKLSEQMASAESELATIGFARDEIHVRSHMSCC